MTWQEAVTFIVTAFGIGLALGVMAELARGK